MKDFRWQDDDTKDRLLQSLSDTLGLEEATDSAEKSDAPCRLTPASHPTKGPAAHRLRQSSPSRGLVQLNCHSPSLEAPSLLGTVGSASSSAQSNNYLHIDSLFTQLKSYLCVLLTCSASSVPQLFAHGQHHRTPFSTCSLWVRIAQQHQERDSLLPIEEKHTRTANKSVAICLSLKMRHRMRDARYVGGVSQHD
mgnify:CR=1